VNVDDQIITLPFYHDLDRALLVPVAVPQDVRGHFIYRQDQGVNSFRVEAEGLGLLLDELAGIGEVFQDTGLAAKDIDEIRHGTTVAANAILELKGAKAGLITTKGFRDVLEIRTLRMPRLYDITWEKPVPLVERYLRLGVDERINVKGEVIKPLDPADAEAAVEKLLAEGVEAIAVCLLHSYNNPAHELMIKEIIQKKLQNLMKYMNIHGQLEIVLITLAVLTRNGKVISSPALNYFFP